MAMPPGPVWRFTVDEYHRMIETGVLGDDDRVELIEGWILPKMPQNPEHMKAIGLLEDALRQTLPTGWCVRSQGPITTRDSEPEPDVVVARGQRIDYGHRDPGPNDLGLVVEISYTSLTFDRTAKAKMYARAGIGVYWIVNTDVREIEVYSEPEHGTTFKIYLPRVRSPEREVRVTEWPTPRNGGEAVLLVEDDERVRSSADRAPYATPDPVPFSVECIFLFYH
jgi:Uma2 family endonuclease